MYIIENKYILLQRKTDTYVNVYKIKCIIIKFKLNKKISISFINCVDFRSFLKFIYH